MTDAECIELLQWLLPRLGFRWEGFRRVRRQVCKRFVRRSRELGLDDAGAYRDYLAAHPEEAEVAEYLCRVTISRFCRDRGVFESLTGPVMDVICTQRQAQGRRRIHVWSAGCASGEEAYSLALGWHFRGRHRWPDLKLSILGTDIDDVLLERARRGCYARGTLKELPGEWLAEGFQREEGTYRLRESVKAYARFCRHDLRNGPPATDFDLVLCRNLAFTYFDDDLQLAAGVTICEALREGGFLVLGKHECLPDAVSGFDIWSGSARIYRKRVPGA